MLKKTPTWILPWAASLLLALPAFGGEVIDRIKIVVYDQAITEQEIKLRLAAAGSAQGGFDLLGQEARRAEVTETLIDEALLSHQGKVLNIEVPPEQVDQAVDQFRQQRGLDERRFEEMLESQQLTLADFKERIEEQQRRERVLQQEVGSQISINEEELRQKHLSQTPVVEKVQAKHILILAKQGSASEAEVEAARKKIAQLRQEALQGADFGQLAVKHSEDPLAKDTKGDLGWFKREDMDPDFAQAAFALAPGQLSGPVRSRFGFHLILVNAKEKKPVVPFAEVRDRMHQQAFQEEYQAKLEAYKEELRKNATIVYR